MCWNLLHADDDRFARRAWTGYLEDLQDEGRGPFVLSYEDLGYYHQDGRTPRRLQSLFPSAHILAVVRNQRDALRSFYNLYLKQGGTQSFVHWIGGKGQGLDRLDYDGAVAAYVSAFGRDNVSVLLYEDLVASPEEFLGRLVELVPGTTNGPGVADPLPRVNPSITRPGGAAVRCLNRVFSVGQFNPAPLVPIADPNHVLAWVRTHERRLRSSRFNRATRHERTAAEHLSRRFEAGNVRLAEMTGIDLRAYGYPLPA